METEKITAIRRCRPSTVYNLSVLKDESYIANGVAVHNCRSTWIPIPVTMRVKDSWRYEQRNFSKQLGQDLKPLKELVDKKDIKKMFENIKKFKDDWGIPSYILEEDIEKRLLKLGVGISN